MFLSGADGQTPELRPPSIKGALRFWWRAMNGHLDIKTLRKKEAELFGDKNRRSPFNITVEYDIKSTDIIKETPIPYKLFFKMLAFCPELKFSVILKSASKNILENVSYVFILFSYLGGLGKHARRGFGSFKVLSVSEKNAEEIFHSLKEMKNFSLKNTYLIINNINPFLEYDLKDKIMLRSGTQEKYPYLKEVSALFFNENNEKLLDFVSKTSHEISSKYKNETAYVLGNARGFRFASPLILRVNQKYIVASKLATFPPPKFRRYINEKIQDEFIQTLTNDVLEKTIEQKKNKILNINTDWTKQIEKLKLDLRVTKLSIKNYKKFIEKNIFQLNPNITVVIGDNGFGKTSFLEALAISLDLLANKLFDKQLEFDEENLKKQITFNQNESEIVCEFDARVTFSLSNVGDNEYLERIYKNGKYTDEFKIITSIEFNKYKITKKVNLEQDRDWKKFMFNSQLYRMIKDHMSHITEKFPVAFFGNKIEQNEVIESKHEVQNYIYYNALSPKRYNFKNIQNWIKGYFSKLDNEISQSYFKSLTVKLEEALNSETVKVSYKVEVKNGNKNALKDFDIVIHKTEKKNSKEHTNTISYNQLSAGEKNVFSIVADLITRIYLATEKTDKEAIEDLLIRAKAIVLIDELDLHLHPKWQREILLKLRKIFPHIQFIITTHSPFVLQSVTDGNIISLQDLKILSNLNGWELTEIAKDVMANENILMTDEYKTIFSKFNNSLIDRNYEEMRESFNWLNEHLHPNNPMRVAVELQFNIFHLTNLNK
jgi:CRISPR-associated protein Cmr1